MSEQQELIDQFQKGMDPSSAAAMAKRLTAAEAQIAALKDKPDQAAALAQAIKDRDAARLALQNYKKKHPAKAAKSPGAAGLRQLGPIGEKETLDRAALREAIATGSVVEVAFSDGKNEVAGAKAVDVTGFTWKDHAAGYLLADPVDVYGRGPDDGTLAIAGYALIVDDKQVAYAPLAEPLRVQPGGHARIVDDILF